MNKSADFRDTLERFLKAEVADTLPTEQLVKLKESMEEAFHDAQKHAARRRNLTRKVTGRLVFRSTEKDAAPKPLSFMKVELWDRDVVTAGDYLGAGETDVDGRFEIAYDPSDAGMGDTPDLDLRVIETFRGQEHVFAVEHGPDEVRGDHDFGTLGVAYYEYHPAIPLPHILTFDYGKARLDAMPQSYALGRKLAMADVASRVLGIRLEHYLDGQLTLQQIQDDYKGRTRYAPPYNPKLDVSPDAAFVYRVLNGVCPSLFVRDAEGLLRVIYTWDAYEMDGEHYLPNIDAAFRLEGRALIPVSITTQERLNNAKEPHSPLAPPVTTRPGDAGWARAKHVFLCNAYLFSQAANHLARGHFNVEQYGLAAHRNLRRSPLRALLDPHTQEVFVINTEGESAIFGEDGLITKNGALTSKSLVQAIGDNANIDWYGWSPRAPLTDDHDYAHVANLYWEVLVAYVDAFFAEHEKDIVAHWREVRGFSDDLVAHCVAWSTPTPPPGCTFVDTREVAREHPGRATVGGKLRAATPFATSDTPKPGDLENLKQVCRYIIFHATLWHTWINDTTEALEADYAQYNPADRSTPKELTDHISLNLALSQTRYGLILRNEDGDLSSTLIDLLKARRREFAQHGFDIARIRSRINI